MGVLAYHMTEMHVIAFAFLRWTIPLSFILDYNIQGVEKGVGCTYLEKGQGFFPAGLGNSTPPISKNLTPPSGTRPHFSDQS